MSLGGYRGEYSRMSYISRVIHKRQCYCTILTTFRCHCLDHVCPNQEWPEIYDGMQKTSPLKPRKVRICFLYEHAQQKVITMCILQQRF